MSKKYPTINVVETGQNIKQIIKSKGFSVRDVQESVRLERTFGSAGRFFVSGE